MSRRAAPEDGALGESGSSMAAENENRVRWPTPAAAAPGKEPGGDSSAIPEDPAKTTMIAGGADSGAAAPAPHHPQVLGETPVSRTEPPPETEAAPPADRPANAARPPPGGLPRK